MNSFKKFSEDKLPDKCNFFSFLKDESIKEKIIDMLLMFEMCLK